MKPPFFFSIWLSLSSTTARRPNATNPVDFLRIILLFGGTARRVHKGREERQRHRNDYYTLTQDAVMIISVLELELMIRCN